jgi:penicillin-binding protein 1A
MGLHTPLPDTPSLPIGADEVIVLEHVIAYATFPNLGKAVTPHAILEMRTADGNVIWRFDRDGPKPRQVLPPQVATDMIYMMNKVVEEGTARRAMIPGIRVAGKTGTTNAYRDAWFVGYTGNLVGGVWIGNDDYSSTNRLTGGSLPAMVWQAVMSYAHQGLELKPLPGLPPAPPQPAPSARSQIAISPQGMPAPVRPTVLTERGTAVLVRIEHLMEDASRALGAPSTTVSGLPIGSPRAAAQPETAQPEAFASASGGSTTGAVRGN